MTESNTRKLLGVLALNQFQNSFVIEYLTNSDWDRACNQIKRFDTDVLCGKWQLWPGALRDIASSGQIANPKANLIRRTVAKEVAEREHWWSDR